MERLLEKLVDTPVRGFVYEAAGSVDPAVLAAGGGMVHSAARTWRIPVAVVETERAGPSEWSQEMVDLALGLLSPAGQRQIAKLG